MEKLSFHAGDIILFEGLYGCSADTCDETLWGVAGRRLPPTSCGHPAAWRLIRRRIERYW